MSDVSSVFASFYGIAPEARASAPGRVNLLGDHTDYNGGFVLPTTIPQLTTVEVSTRSEYDEAYTSDLHEHVRFGRNVAPQGFARYLYGCLRVLETKGLLLPPVRIAVSSNVPLGAGLSSSAALEVAMLRALDRRFCIGLDGMELAKLAQMAEVRHAGVVCGIMDQIASSLGHPDMMLFLDTLSLEHNLLPLPPGTELLVVHSGVHRELSSSPYNQRRAECETAAKALGIKTLRELHSLEQVATLPSPLRQRAQHVFSENERVVAATSANPVAFGNLMNKSHESLSSDFEVSVPEVDALVSFLQAQDDVFGARMTGAGFGGACVALVRTGTACDSGKRVISWSKGRAKQVTVVVPAPVEYLSRLTPC